MLWDRKHSLVPGRYAGKLLQGSETTPCGCEGMTHMISYPPSKKWISSPACREIVFQAQKVHFHSHPSFLEEGH